MKRLIHFFSLAVMTQVILMLSQLILLPLQVRLWGQSATAEWYSALALATITYVVDCGLRTAGHSELIKANENPAWYSSESLHFQRIWGWIRILILLVTGVLIAGDFVRNIWLHAGAYPSWRMVLIVACALETILIIRITYLDSLGRYRGAEASYFAFAVLRLVLSVPALQLLHWKAGGLAAVYVLTALLALLAQGRWLCRSTPLLQLAAKFPALSWSVLALARHTVAEPLANWARLSLPVLVIARIAPPMAVTTYVALRAVFGAGRTTIQQLARVASVEVIRSRQDGEQRRAESLLNVFVVTAVFFGACLGFFVVVDNMRILGLWLKHFDQTLFQQIALAFALTAPFFSYQIPMNLMFRAGFLGWVARRHYAFLIYSGLFAVCSLFVKALPIYLAMLVISEVALSTSFFIPGSKTPLDDSRSGVAGLRVAICSALAIAALWMVAHQNRQSIFSALAFLPMAESSILMLGMTVSMAALLYGSYGFHVSLIRRSSPLSSPLAMAE